MFGGNESPWVRSVNVTGKDDNGWYTATWGEGAYSKLPSHDPDAEQGSFTALRINRSLVLLGRGGYYAAKTTE